MYTINVLPGLQSPQTLPRLEAQVSSTEQTVTDDMQQSAVSSQTKEAMRIAQIAAEQLELVQYALLASRKRRTWRA